MMMRLRRLNGKKSNQQVDCYDLAELTDSLDDEAALRRRAESVAVVS
jgi:hypothetical protein